MRQLALPPARPLSPPASDARGTLRRPVLAAVLGGALWIPYGVLELVEPWGADTRYDESGGYDVVVDRGLHHLTSLPGSAAVLLCAAGLLVLMSRLGVSSATARAAGWGAGALAVVSALGVLMSFDPVFTAGRILGTVLLGVALVAAARAAGRAERAAGWRPALLALGVLALLLLLVWPLVFAVQWLAPGAGAAVLALHGLGWAALGAAVPAGNLG